jgi:geranylgeranyl diphosphate synthase type II
MAIEVCEGQQYDMDFEREKSISMENYLKMTELKTAVLLASSLKIGAIIADASVENQQIIYDFGIYLGLAFQLQDDFLDVYGDDNFGKKIGGDIVENKKTFLLIKALELADKKDKSTIFHYLSNNHFHNNEKIEAIVNIYNKLNISELINIEMRKFHKLAIENLEKISNFVPEVKASLLQISETCLTRKI